MALVPIAGITTPSTSATDGGSDHIATVPETLSLIPARSTQQKQQHTLQKRLFKNIILRCFSTRPQRGTPNLRERTVRISNSIASPQQNLEQESSFQQSNDTYPQPPTSQAAASISGDRQPATHRPRRSSSGASAPQIRSPCTYLPPLRSRQMPYHRTCTYCP